MTATEAGGEVAAAPGAGAQTGAGLLHGLVERLATYYASEAFRDEALAAREEYFTRAGKVFEDDGALFERRIAAFQEWYLIERPLSRARAERADPTAFQFVTVGRAGAPAVGVAPVVRALEGEGDRRFSVAERQALAALASSHRSLFDIAAVDEREVLLEDVIGGARFSVRERRSTIGFEVGDLVEARLVWDGESVVFGRTLLFHPRDAREQVLDIVDHAAAKEQTKQDVLFLLGRLHVRWYRAGHVAASRVYREGLVR